MVLEKFKKNHTEIFENMLQRKKIMFNYVKFNLEHAKLI